MRDKLRKLHIGSDFDNFFKFSKKQINGLRTGISQIDDSLRGLAGLVGIQGAPGACKSTLALQIASYNALNGVPVLMIDRENGRERLRSRLISQVTGVSPMKQEDLSYDTLLANFKKIKKLPIFLETNDSIDPQYIHSLAAAMIDIFPEKRVLMVMDSLQALPRFQMEERQALEHWLVSLDQIKLAFQDKLTIMVTSEKSRGRYDMATKEGGKGTGNIEYKCEQLLDMREAEDNPMQIIAQVVKNRDNARSEDIYLRKQMDRDGKGFLFKLNEDYEVEL